MAHLGFSAWQSLWRWPGWAHLLQTCAFVHEQALCPRPRHLKHCVGPRLGSKIRVKADSPSTLKYWPSRSLAASERLVTYTTIDPYAFGKSFRLIHETFAILTSFSFSSISTTPVRSSPCSSNTAVRHALSTLTGCY
jgi:hypothetical protein